MDFFLSMSYITSESSSIIGVNNSENDEEVIKIGEKENEQEDNDENEDDELLWSNGDDEYGSESLDENNDVLEVSYDGIQVGGGGGENNALAAAAAAAASKDETASQLLPYGYDVNHSEEEYDQHSSKRRTSMIVDLTLEDGDESDCTKPPPLNPSQQSVRLKNSVNVTGPSQTESIGDFSEDDDDYLKQVPGRPNTSPDCNCIQVR